MFLRAAGALLFFRVLRSVQTMLLRMLSGRERSRVSDNPARERNSLLLQLCQKSSQQMSQDMEAVNMRAGEKKKIEATVKLSRKQKYESNGCSASCVK